MTLCRKNFLIEGDFDLFTSFALLAVRTPGMIVGPIAALLGTVYNALFNFIYSISPVNALGIAIILFTVIVKLIFTPLIVKQQKSTIAMQKIQPELLKIRKKYEGKKDMESQQRMSLEMQKIQKDNNVSMLGGCLPLLIQLPILYALFYIFQQAYVYVDVVGQNYDAITNVIMNIPVDTRLSALSDIIIQHKLTVDVAQAADIKNLISQLTVADWNTFTAAIGSFADQISPLLTVKNEMEYFLGVSMVTRPGLSCPGIIIPVAAGATTFIQTYALTRNSGAQSPAGQQDPTMQSMKIMNYMMPIMMGVMTINLPAGLGVYWTVSNLLQAGQTVLITKALKRHDKKLEEAGK